MCGVQHSGTVIFLYLTSKAVSTMEKSIQTDHEPDHEPDHELDHEPDHEPQKLETLGKHKQPVSFQLMTFSI